MNKFLPGSETVPTFSGNTGQMSTQVWLKRLEALAKIFNRDDRFLIYQMTSKLSGNARLWFDAQREIDFSWAQWKEMLLVNFPEGRGIAAKLHDFVTLKRDTNENVIDFYFKKLSKFSYRRSKLGEFSSRRRIICKGNRLKSRVDYLENY